MNETNINGYIRDQSNYINQNFHQLFRQKVRGNEKILEVMEYSFFSSGKRVRPLLVLEAGRLFHGDDEDLLIIGLAIEMIHAYSLMHDDLPAMDDDDYRRGNLSSHKMFGEALAILGGDGLLTEAFGLICQIKKQARVANLIREIVRASGIKGMISGQVMDLDAEKNDKLTFSELKGIHNSKTGAMITTSIMAGALYSVDEEGGEVGSKDNCFTLPVFENLTAYGESLGLLFQITDDILDETGIEKELGKPVGSDLRKGKKTYTTMLGIDRAKELAREECLKAVSLADKFPPGDGFFRGLPGYILERQK